MSTSTPARRWLVAGFVAYGLAMGVLEAVVVVYLRELYYPRGFDFPMAVMPTRVYAAEVVREVCTIVMLLGVALLAGRTLLQRWASFLLSFAIWDLAYYAGLKAFLGWPDSLLAWDILFLIPVPWLGPVLAPVLYCTAMGAVGWAMLVADRAGIRMKPVEWAILAASAALVLWPFMADAVRLVADASRSEPDAAARAGAIALAFQQFVPRTFGWAPFLLGLAAGYGAALSLARRARASCGFAFRA